VFEITVDTSGPLATVNGILRKVDHFKRVDIGAELSAWQTEDMHRKRPFTMGNRSKGTAATKIRPHSRYEVQRSRMAQRRIARRSKRANYIPSTEQRRWSTRAILRADLYARLIARMDRALNDKLKCK
jgi:hypothetical protein